MDHAAQKWKEWRYFKKQERPQFAASDQVKKMLLLDPEQRPETRLIILGNGL